MDGNFAGACILAHAVIEEGFADPDKAMECLVALTRTPAERKIIRQFIWQQEADDTWLEMAEWLSRN